MAQNKNIPGSRAFARDAARFTVEVAYATPSRQKIFQVTVARGATVRDAIISSGILNHFPEIDLAQQKVGIFSKIAELSDSVGPLDRIEIYRPLIIDPKEARRLKAKIKNAESS